MSNITCVSNSQVKTKYYSKVIKGGLKVYVINTEGELPKKTQINILVNYGGNDREYIDNFTGKNVIIPEGTAHLIEHLVCNKGKTFKEVLEEFMNMNTSINACTSKKYTNYIAEVYGDYKKPLEYLIDMVLDAKITQKQVDKELGIVFSEMELTKKVESVKDIILKNSYEVSSIIGTKEELYKADANLINNIYDNYYVLPNIAILIQGNLIQGEVFKVIDEKIKKLNIKKSLKPVRVIKPLEKPTINCFIGDESLVKKTEIALKYGEYSKKISSEIEVAFDIFGIINLYKISNFVKDLKNEGVINSNIYWSYDKKHNFVVVSAESNYSLLFKERLLEYLKKCKKKKITEEEFELAKNVLYEFNLTSYLRNPLYKIGMSFIDSTYAFSEVDILTNMSIEKYNKCLKKILNPKENYMYYN